MHWLLFLLQEILSFWIGHVFIVGSGIACARKRIGWWFWRPRGSPDKSKCWGLLQQKSASNLVSGIRIYQLKSYADKNVMSHFKNLKFSIALINCTMLQKLYIIVTLSLFPVWFELQSKFLNYKRDLPAIVEDGACASKASLAGFRSRKGTNITQFNGKLSYNLSKAVENSEF